MNVAVLLHFSWINVKVRVLCE